MRDRWLLGVLLLAPPAWAQPTIDFATPAPLGLLAGAHTDIADVHVGGVYWDGARWRSHGEGARLFRFDRVDLRADGSVKTKYHGLGFCAPIDLQPGKTCGQFDQIGQVEVARITRPGARPLTAIWLSEIVGDDQVDVGGSSSATYEPDGVTWFAHVVAGEGAFNSGVPCEGTPTQAPRPCDAIEGPVAVPLAHQTWRSYWIRGTPGGQRAFVVWGVDLEAAPPTEPE